MKPGVGLLAGALVAVCPVWGQAGSAATSSAVAAPPVAADLRQTLAGEWVGVLEYRDYSEPAGSTKRVDLPTWLTITAGADGQQTWRYVYDDGPGKVVTETDAITFDPAKDSFVSVDNGRPAKTFAVHRCAELKPGWGMLVLTGSATDAGKPAELREMLTIRRNLLGVLKETRVRGVARGVWVPASVSGGAEGCAGG